MKKIIVLIAVISIVSLFCFSAGASGSSVPELSEDVFESLMWKVCHSTTGLYDLNTLQTVYPTVLFGYDSNGVAYAGGKCYYYIDYGNKDLSGRRAEAFEGLKECVTLELAEKMTEDFHVPGGPDVEVCVK